MQSEMYINVVSPLTRSVNVESERKKSASLKIPEKTMLNLPTLSHPQTHPQTQRKTKQEEE